MIFHYTRESSLEPILKSGGLVATRVDHDSINDPNELRALRETLVALMQQSAAPLLNHAKTTGQFNPPDDWDSTEVPVPRRRSFMTS